MQNEDQIRQRAYELWDAEGRPEGRDRQHWDQACRELGAPEQSATDPGERVPGPALIEEPDSTTVVLPGDTAFVSPRGHLLIDVGG